MAKRLHYRKLASYHTISRLPEDLKPKGHVFKKSSDFMDFAAVSKPASLLTEAAATARAQMKYYNKSETITRNISEKEIRRKNLRTPFTSLPFRESAPNS